VVAGEDSDLELVGSGFVYGASVLFEGVALATTWGSDTRLTVTVPGILATGGATPSVSVQNPSPGGGTSNLIQLLVYVSPPEIDAIFPGVVFAGAADFTLVISGSNFDPTATVTVDGAPRAATFVNSGRLELVVSAADIASPGAVDIQVTNPAPSGQALAQLQVLDAPASGSLLLSARTGGNELVVSDAGGTEVTSTIVVDGHQVDASPIGTSAAYYQGGRVREIDPFTGVGRRVTTAAEEAALSEEQWPKYSADGQWIYYMGRVSGGRWELWRSPTVGGAGERLLWSPSETYGYPNPSHGGDRVVFTKGVSSGSTYLWIRDLIGGTSTPVSIYGATSRWTPDDEWIVYWDWTELRAVRPDGTGDFAIAPGTQTGSGFDISPNGDYIIAASRDSSRGFLISFPGGIVQELPALGSVASMAWYGP
jgi:hypothetical protein